MEKLFDLNVYIDSSFCVENEENRICMINFHGDCASDFFTGKILPGGVDTQKFIPKEKMTLSARYILEGVDKNQIPTKIFIENNGIFDNKENKIVTSPTIITDNKDLKWLETENLTGTVCGTNEEGHIIIEFWKK